MMSVYPFHSNSCLYFPVHLSKTWNQKTRQTSQDSSSWASQIMQTCSPSCVGSSCPCTWSPRLGICSSSWPSALTSTSTLPCTSSSPTSFVDISFISTIVPKMLSSIQTENKSITYAGCLTQVYFFMVFICTDNLLLTIMAICHPLYYVICDLRLLLSLFVSILNALIHSLMVLQLSFCTDVKIPHFYELAQILKLACSDTLIKDILVYLVTKL